MQIYFREELNNGTLFDILSSINNPNQQGSVDQLSNVVNSVQQLGAERGIPASTLQTIFSSLGGFLGPVLKQQSGLGGSPLDGLAGLAGAGAGAAALQSFLPPQLQQQIIQGISQKQVYQQARFKPCCRV